MNRKRIIQRQIERDRRAKQGWRIYNPDNTRAGFDCEYRIQGTELQINIEGSDHFTDWTKNIIGSFFTVKYEPPLHVEGELKNYYFHKAWYNSAKEIYDYIMKKKLPFYRLQINGYSAGASVAGILYLMFFYNGYDPKIYCYAMPRFCKNNSFRFINYRNKYDIVPSVPFWYKKNKGEIIVYGKSKLFWKAHLDYDWRIK